MNRKLVFNLSLFFSIRTVSAGKESLIRFLLDVSAPHVVRNAEKRFIINASQMELGARLTAKLESPSQEPLKVDKFDLEHVCFGSVSTEGKLSGLHTDLYIGLDRRIIKPEDKFGLSYVEWLSEFGNKKSTLFPHDWDAEIIALKILESLINARSVLRRDEQIRVIGTTKGGVDIESLICACKESRQKIATSFPRINGL